jgi:hypothetical protein
MYDDRSEPLYKNNCVSLELSGTDPKCGRLLAVGSDFSGVSVIATREACGVAVFPTHRRIARYRMFVVSVDALANCSAEIPRTRARQDEESKGRGERGSSKTASK